MMSIEPTYKSHDEAKKAGWFSRRHQTNEESNVHKAKIRTKHGGNSLKKDNKTK